MYLSQTATKSGTDWPKMCAGSQAMDPMCRGNTREDELSSSQLSSSQLQPWPTFSDCLRIRESEWFRLEKTPKIIKSNSQPDTVKATDKLCPQAPHLQIFQGWWLQFSLGSMLQCLTTLSEKEFFLISSLNLLWCNLRLCPLALLFVTWEERPTPPVYNLISGTCRRPWEPTGS